MNEHEGPGGKPLPYGAAHHYDLNLRDTDLVVRTLVDLSEFLIKTMPAVAETMEGNDHEANGSEWLVDNSARLREALDNDFGLAVGEVRYCIDAMLDTFNEKLDATVGVGWGRSIRGDAAMEYRGPGYKFTPEFVTIDPEEAAEDEFEPWMRLGRALKRQVEYVPLATKDALWVAYMEPDNVMSGHDSMDNEDWARISCRLLGLAVVWGNPQNTEVAMVTSRQGQGIEDQMKAFIRDL